VFRPNEGVDSYFLSSAGSTYFVVTTGQRVLIENFLVKIPLNTNYIHWQNIGFSLYECILKEKEITWSITDY
jgi:hypothetical protein